MLFKDTFITDAGSEIFARALAEEGKIIWGAAKTSNKILEGIDPNVINQLEDIVDSGSVYTSSGYVTNAVISVADQIASLYCELTNEEYSGIANTFGVWAKIGSDPYKLAIVARCGSAAPTTVDSYVNGIEKIYVDFSLQVTATQVTSVPVSEHWYARAAALQDEIEQREAEDVRVTSELTNVINDNMDRTVTTHSANDPSVGDIQDILRKCRPQ